MGIRTQGFPGPFLSFWLGDPLDGTAVPDIGGERGFEGKTMCSVLVFMERSHKETGYVDL